MAPLRRRLSGVKEPTASGQCLTEGCVAGCVCSVCVRAAHGRRLRRAQRAFEELKFKTLMELDAEDEDEDEDE